MSGFQRLRQACRGDDPERGDDAVAGAWIRQEPSAAAEAPRGHPSLPAGADGARQGHGRRPGLNRVYLSGVLAADPQRDRGRDGEPVALLLVAFPAPDDRESAGRPETASCEIEVPEHVTEVHSEGLRAGGSIFVVGQLSGGGGVIATEIHLGPPPDEAG